MKVSNIITAGIGTPALIDDFVLFGLQPSGPGATHIVSLGVGSPYGIPEFLLFGLRPESAFSAPDCRRMVIDAEGRTATIDAESRTVAVDLESRLFLLEC